MAYKKINWVNGETPINADNLNHMEDGIAEAFRYLGVDLIASVEDDTPANWKELGLGYAYIQTAGILNNQPATYGMIINKIAGKYIYQKFISYTSGSVGQVWERTGGSESWFNNGDWIKLLNEKNTANYIVEEGIYTSYGISGKYTKWNSGKCEIVFNNFGASFGAGTAFMGGYYHLQDTALTLPSFCTNWELKSAIKSDAKLGRFDGIAISNNAFKMYYTNGSNGLISGSSFGKAALVFEGTWK